MLTGTKCRDRVDACMLEDIEADDGETEPLSLPDYDEEKLREEKRKELADLPEEDLRAELARQDEEEREWQDEYGVDGPDELEATIAEGMDADERQQRRRVAYYWRKNQHVREMIEEVFDG
ncbi:hypothetical protein AMS69_17955 [Haloarcula rubripromontorii]|uniref:Uncharacterized protein n=2 Tax=Haloarcula rubripromontorii TaxID=1705562 RepID=A0A0M9AIL3_9EURY|nr:hypothetical protein AMS69_17955 [Haloarcula rubripromontorii]